MELDRLAWTDVAARAATSLLAVPVGSTEQHGPHLPLSTDTDIAAALCRRLAAARGDVLVAPAVAYGSSGEHAAFPGTLSIGAAATEHLLVELGRSADAFAGVLFVSTHGGNAAPVRDAVRRLVSESRPVRAWSPPAVPTRAGPPDAHAGRTETSVLLSLDAALVRAGAAEAGCTEPLGDLLAGLQAVGVRPLSPNGVLGDPAGASAEEGEELLSAWAAALAEHTAGWP
ncbi:MAG: mycofactocin biosynthesis peptidyl-dipeptidase MftE [Actinomycetota bacterium]|nr:mycofactocin biosynthesis peptidyl-dipeptidase MftE [Actinomycetota bacterium]